MSEISEKMLKTELVKLLEWSNDWLRLFIIPIHEKCGNDMFVLQLKAKSKELFTRKKELEESLKKLEEC